MSYVERLVQRVPLFFLLMGLAAFGMGRRASRTTVESQIPGWVGVVLLVVAVGSWGLINVVLDVGSE
ncbi:hypothetical protein I7X12_16830 [Halosimplex litoreum]|uniref:Uncharacterized protein n=1 Tax=Halosimplex litoreum TaxID=1198301 RepID=A0A7T3FXE2_9EURY|nr:hypothetical protein [Halosimplex litoreum]QPV62386.1 hypothetical protein I7X12_16830 [Halosimplex litoreum]